jgi:hypothetical protein
MSRKLEIELELKIAREAIKGLLKAGYSVSVDNGETESHASDSQKHIEAALFLTDEDTLYAWKEGKQYGWVQLIYGNVEAVISDYSMNLEEALKEANALAESYS